MSADDFKAATYLSFLMYTGVSAYKSDNRNGNISELHCVATLQCSADELSLQGNVTQR